LWVPLQDIALCCRVQIWEDLRIIDENIDIDAFTIVYLEYKGGVTAGWFWLLRAPASVRLFHLPVFPASFARHIHKPPKRRALHMGGRRAIGDMAERSA